VFTQVSEGNVEYFESVGESRSQHRRDYEVTQDGASQTVWQMQVAGQYQYRDREFQASIQESNGGKQHKLFRASLLLFCIPRDAGSYFVAEQEGASKVDDVQRLVWGETTALKVLPKIMQSNHRVQLRTYHASSSTRSSRVR